MKLSVLARVARALVAAVVLMGLIGPVVPAQANVAGHSEAFSISKHVDGAVLRTAALHTAALSVVAATVYVYITNTGHKYHRATCRYLRYGRRKVTLKWAKSHGYTACKVCKPPR